MISAQIRVIVVTSEPLKQTAMSGTPKNQDSLRWRMLHSLTDKLFGCKGEDKCV